MSGRRKNRRASAPAPALRTTPATDRAALEVLADRWGLGRWDVLIAGDGSGAGWKAPAGWGGVLVERKSGGRQRFYGAISRGTSHLAELYPYVQALSWYAERRARRGESGPLAVVGVTDARSIAAQWRRLKAGRLAPAETGSATGLWAALLAFDAAGLSLSFVWAPRATSLLNCYADELARRAVRAMAGVTPPSAGGRPVSLLALNGGDGADAAAEVPAPPTPGRRRRRRGRRAGCPPAGDP